jgi:hypothetical protein
MLLQKCLYDVRKGTLGVFEIFVIHILDFREGAILVVKNGL